VTRLALFCAYKRDTTPRNRKAVAQLEWPSPPAVQRPDAAAPTGRNVYAKIAARKRNIFVKTINKNPRKKLCGIFCVFY